MRHEYFYIYICKHIKNEKVVLHYVKLINPLSFPTRFAKSGPTYRRQPSAPNTARSISCKAWSSPVEHPSRESKHDIKESQSNMFNPIFKGNVQSRKHPGRCAFAEPKPWWRHQMETSSALLTLCVGNSPVSEFPSQRPVARSFDVFFDLRLNKRLSKQSWGWWYETPSCSLWRHCNVHWLWDSCDCLSGN